MLNVKFQEAIKTGYTFKGKTIAIGGAVLDGQVVIDSIVNLPLSTMNRHGLIAGATGTGKTKTLQKIVEQLSLAGVPTLSMDIKGDLSGLSQAGVLNDKIQSRVTSTGIAWNPHQFPVEFLSISDQKGTKMRATISEFGPVLLSKILELNDTQGGIISLMFKYCDDNNLPLLDLQDFKKTLQYLTNEGKEAIEKEYGAISTTSTATIMRKIIELEEQGANNIFGEKSFEVEDLIRTDASGNGFVNILRLTDMQSKPKLFSTFMLCLLTEIYNTFPEMGDVEKPKLCIFIDEAHLIFESATQSLLDQIETIIKLIRSKGVGIYFITQNPADVPASILGQLGLKVQHALRAFTAADNKVIKLTAQNYPISEFYDVEKLLTSLGMGEAIITALSEKGIPTPLVHTMLSAPESRMDVITDNEMNTIISRSAIAGKYNEVINRDSAYEILTKKLEVIANNQVIETTQNSSPASKENTTKSASAEKGMLESLSKNTMVRQISRSVTTEIARGLMGMFFGKKR